MTPRVGIRVERPEDVGPTWGRALAASRPVVVEAVTDPEAPPLPPHITFENAVSFMKSIGKGDPESGGTIRGAFKVAIETIVPHKG